MGITGRDAAAGHSVIEYLLDGTSGRLQVHSTLTLPYPVPGMEELRVVVVSDDPLARTGIALLLGGQEGLLVAGQVGVDEATLSILRAGEVRDVRVTVGVRNGKE
jgi:hypothetical protein